MQLRLFIHANSGIADADRDKLGDICAIAIEAVQGCPELVIRLNAKLATAGHGIARVDHQINNDLFEVRLINDHCPVGPQIKRHLNVFTNHAGQEADQFTNRAVRVQRSWTRNFLAAKGQ